MERKKVKKKKRGVTKRTQRDALFRKRERIQNKQGGGDGDQKQETNGNQKKGVEIPD